ncbi:Hydrogenase maturation factor HypC [Frankia sp. AiPs1]|uniref:HypC/HybG/HupF family hydrogenase formation chaperone n=1 Tax=Frankia sp. AiPa1 TaxID=573492 RepID=UPI00202B17BE|nr:HypC/HybG/HupF family hydrogenase formation chaperone [Frankia sp. AiPa1]MCL9762244.1 HypC/HybG/HupF family hydrogenase formation chaperone [Frankia sp. AiPa1]
MCLGIPGRITEIWEDRGTRMALIDFGGATRTACLAYLPDAAVGDYTIIHAGFALTVVDEAAAHRTLTTFRELGILETEVGT